MEAPAAAGRFTPAFARTQFGPNLPPSACHQMFDNRASVWCGDGRDAQPFGTRAAASVKKPD